MSTAMEIERHVDAVCVVFAEIVLVFIAGIAAVHFGFWAWSRWRAASPAQTTGGKP